MPVPAKFDGLYIVLVATRNPLNLGAAARAMTNFGFSRLRVVNPYGAAFREARSAVGAAELLAHAEEHKSVAKAIADCGLVVGTTAATGRKLHHPLRGLEQGATDIRKQLGSDRVALMFGSEKRGLSNEDLNHCHWLLRVPTREGHMSMNLGQAVAVCLYELVRDIKAEEERNKPQLATAGDLERISVALLDALRFSGYLNPGSAASGEEKVRRLVRRLSLRASDSEVWTGMLRQILWKLRSDR